MLTIPWRTGVNLREFSYYGPEYLQYTQLELQDRQLAQLKDLGIKLVRFFASHQNASPQTSLDRNRRVLDRLDQLGIQAIVCLDDSVSPQFAVPRKDPNFPRTNTGHLDKRYWHQKQYLNDYVPHITPIVKALANHSAVLIWELGNEYAIHPRPYANEDGQAFIQFARSVSETIKRLAPTKLISTGLVNSRQVGPDSDWEAFSRGLYGLDTIDVISIHYYDDDGEKTYSDIDVKVAQSLQKPFYVGEVGALAGKHGGKLNRPDYYRSEIQEWRNKGAFTVLPWAFDTSDQDVGVSDTKSFAKIFTDFEDIKRVVLSFAAAVERVTVPAWIPPESRSAGASQTATTASTQQTSQTAQAAQTGQVSAQSAAAQTAEKAKPLIRTFRVVFQTGLNIRKTPSTTGEIIGALKMDDLIQVDPNSRIEAEGVVWWRNVLGWSGEKNLVKNQVLMVEVT